MSKENRQIMRLALAIHQSHAAQRARRNAIHLPSASWQHCQQLVRQIERAQQRGWNLSQTRLERDLKYALSSVRDELHRCSSQVPERDLHPAASAKDVFEDIVWLRTEFSDLGWNFRRQTLSVTTLPITLEGAYLGPFEIEMDWGYSPNDHPFAYRVIAVDPHPPVSNDNVSHPHVEGEAVCEGDAASPIRKAFRQCRIADFFQIVTNLLATYNSGSPFVSLEDWYGVECSDCGATTHVDERWTCERCENDLCSDCFVSCVGCDSICCCQCACRCETCRDWFCDGCLTLCADCGETFCQTCLHENERCDNCYEENDAEETTSDPTDELNQCGATADASVQPDGVEQVAVLARLR